MMDTTRLMHLQLALLVVSSIIVSDIFIEIVAGRINAEILDQKPKFKPTQNCPYCKRNEDCPHCCDSFKPPLYGVPVCRDFPPFRSHCVCDIHSTVPNNISSLTPTIAN
ncbi:transmembrane protein, putative [Medicago truncatula]|uniref:Transmembrane protein, putative n=1 Tax=Medicago truncatula TaxID=3880 RepID=G7J243_MEDTR|nr:transmembrane protein, putative [Medicago truncatula]